VQDTVRVEQDTGGRVQGTGHGFTPQDLGCRVLGITSMAQGLGNQVQGLGCEVQGIMFRTQGQGKRVQGFG
jgi:hypothetical protein